MAISKGGKRNPAQYIYNIESGRIKNICYPLLENIAAALGCNFLSFRTYLDNNQLKEAREYQKLIEKLRMVGPDIKPIRAGGMAYPDVRDEQSEGEIRALRAENERLKRIIYRK